MDKQHHTPIVRALAVIALSVLALAPIRAQFGGGDGTQGNPYIISTTDHWTELANNVNGGNNYSDTYFRLDADLDFTGKTYTIIADDYVRSNISFYGYFNGNGHTIKGVTIDRTEPGTGKSIYIGLFGTIRSNAIVENLTLSNSTIKGRINVGGIVGRTGDFMSSDPNRRSVVRNCHVTGDVTIETVQLYYDGFWQPSGDVGGIVGCIESDRGVVLDCTSAATIKASSNSYCVGGIAGSVYNGRVSGCAYTGSISGGTSYVGGIVGEIDGNDAIFTDNFVGGNCTIGAVGVEGSTQGTDEGYSVSHIYTIRFNSAQQTNGTIDTPPTKTIGVTDYYAADSTITLSNVSTFGTPGGGKMWSYRAYVNNSNQPEVFPQEDGTWQFTMPNGNVVIVPEGAIDITLTGYPYNTKVTFTPANATYTGSALHPTAVVEARGTTLTEGTQFFTDIPAAGFTNAGKYPVKVWGKGGYAGLRIDTFTIAPAPILELTLSETSVYYDGQAHKPTLTVRRSLGRGRSLIIGTEYETDMPAGGFTELGDYIIKVWGISNYTDTLSATYTICHPWQGMGTDREPFLIQSTDDMDRLAALVNGGRDYAGVHFRQMADLNYTGKTYTPVANNDETSCFQGTFDGYIYSITGLSVSSQACTGLFGYVGSSGTVSNVTLVGTNSFVGTTNGSCGSIVAKNYGTVEFCSVAEGANVTVRTQGGTVGGIVGLNYGGTVSSCENHAATVTANVAGGIVGFNNYDGYVEGMNYATVNGDHTAGGICGVNLSGTVIGRHYGSVLSASEMCGGIVGHNKGSVEHSLSTDLMTAVADGSNKGAIIGKNEGTGTARCNYYIGACKFGGINGSDRELQAMRGWPIIVEAPIGFSPYYHGGIVAGTYYDDGTNNYYYVGAGESLSFFLMGGTGYTANGSTLTVAGHDADYDEDYYQLTMPAQAVRIAPVGLTLTLYDNWVNNHNADDIADADGQVRDVTIEGRTLYKDGEWNTICLPFPLSSLSGTPLEGAELMELDTDGTNGLDTATGTLHLTFKTANSILAGRPYIIKWASGTDITDPVFAGVTVDASQPVAVTSQSAGFNAVTFKGTYTFTWLNAGDKRQLFLTAGNLLKYPTEDRYLLPFRAWFTVDENTSQNIRGFALGFGDVQTSLSTLPAGACQPQYHDLQGRRVTAPQKGGIYIVNGKKVFY